MIFDQVGQAGLCRDSPLQTLWALYWSMFITVFGGGSGRCCLPRVQCSTDQCLLTQLHHFSRGSGCSPRLGPARPLRALLNWPRPSRNFLMITMIWINTTITTLQHSKTLQRFIPQLCQSSLIFKFFIISWILKKSFGWCFEKCCRKKRQWQKSLRVVGIQRGCYWAVRLMWMFVISVLFSHLSAGLRFVCGDGGCWQSWRISKKTDLEDVTPVPGAKAGSLICQWQHCCLSCHRPALFHRIPKVRHSTRTDINLSLQYSQAAAISTASEKLYCPGDWWIQSTL